MIETVKIDKAMLKSAAVGLVSAALFVSGYGLLDANRQNTVLRKEITDLRTRLDAYQQNYALIQKPAATPVEVKSDPVAAAPIEPPSVAAQPVAAQPVAAKPYPAEPSAAEPAASAGRITFDMLAPGLEARPPLPLQAPTGGIPKASRLAKAEAPREVARSTGTAITDKQDSTWDNQFVLRSHDVGAGEAASGQLNIAGQ